MLRFLPLIALAAALPALAQDKPVTGEGTTDKPVVITATPLADLRKALQACLARKCPPDQDIDATLAVAETQFVNGDYKGASSTIGKSIDRNKRFAKDYPVAVSDLLRADYRVSEHLGERDSYRIRAFDVVSALKAGLPDNDARVLAAQIEVGDMYVETGRIDEAADKYHEVERRAVGPGLSTVRGMARLRLVGLYSQLTVIDSQYQSLARRSAAVLTGDPDPAMKPFGDAARLLMARLDARRGDTAALDRMIAGYPWAKGSKAPVLLYAPPIDFNLPPPERTVNVGSARMSSFEGEWVDIGFWVAPDGHVTDADVYRSSGRSETPWWTKPILAAIRGRRYAPLDMDPTQPGVLRVERYTRVAWLAYNTGSHIMQREPTPEIHMLDLSIDPPAKPAAK